MDSKDPELFGSLYDRYWKAKDRKQADLGPPVGFTFIYISVLFLRVSVSFCMFVRSFFTLVNDIVSNPTTKKDFSRLSYVSCYNSARRVYLADSSYFIDDRSNNSFSITDRKNSTELTCVIPPKAEWKYKKRKSLASRKEESKEIRRLYPSSVPIILEKAPNGKVATAQKEKYLVPRNLRVADLLLMVRKNIFLGADSSIYLIVGGKVLSPSWTMGEVFDKEKDEDGFLYLMYNSKYNFNYSINSGRNL
ncbi:gamma-aminobutyric acid receptor-associated protein-like 2 [Trichonephila clavipes]|nr:gamma-aminobutyric acid receptor-associated protein-like 2 [Trichonephila clavipes]